MKIRTIDYGSVQVVEAVKCMLLPTIGVVEMDNGDIYEIKSSSIGYVAVKTNMVSDEFIGHICNNNDQW